MEVGAMYPKIQTLWKRDPTNKFRIIEGVVCRPTVDLFDRNGKPVMFKLKVKDYEQES